MVAPWAHIVAALAIMVAALAIMVAPRAPMVASMSRMDVSMGDMGASMARIDASMARPWPAIARLRRSWGASGRPRSRMGRTVGVPYAAPSRQRNAAFPFRNRSLAQFDSQKCRAETKDLVSGAQKFKGRAQNLLRNF